MTKEIKKETLAPEAEASKGIIPNDFWGDVKAAIFEAISNWWKEDKKKILSYLGEIGKSIFNSIVAALKKKQDEK